MIPVRTPNCLHCDGTANGSQDCFYCRASLEAALELSAQLRASSFNLLAPESWDELLCDLRVVEEEQRKELGDFQRSGGASEDCLGMREALAELRDLIADIKDEGHVCLLLTTYRREIEKAPGGVPADAHRYQPTKEWADAEVMHGSGPVCGLPRSRKGPDCPGWRRP